MRRILVIVCFVAGLALAPFAVHAQGIDPAQEQFVSAFLTIRKAEEQANAGELQTALKSYRLASDTLSRIKQQFPTWQSELVDYRLKRTNEAITTLQSKMGAAPAEDPGLLPPILPDANPLAPAPETAPVPPKAKPSKPGNTPADPIAAVQQRIATLENQLQDATEKLASEQKKNVELAKDLTLAVEARREADIARKKAQDQFELNVKSLLDMKAKGEASSERMTEIEAQVAETKKKNSQMEIDLMAAEERITQLVERSKAMTSKATAAAELPARVKALETKLATEQSEKAELTAKLGGMTRERDDARMEIARLKDLNKQMDKLTADNANLLKKLGDAEKQIFAFKSDAPQKDREIEMLKKQVTDTQKALVSSQDKNTELQTQITDLQKQVGDYTKQIQQFKTDKTASADDQRKMEQENKLLQGIVMRVLQEDANRSQRKKMLQKELERLQVNSDTLLRQIDYLTQPAVKLSPAERRLFKKPVIEVQDPNTLAIIKPEGDPPAPAETAKPVEPAPKPVENPEKPPLPSPEPLPEPPKPSDPVKVSKLDTQPPTKIPVETTPGGPQKTTADTTAVRTLPEAVKPLADQAKQAFERENFVDAEKLYDKALQLAPNNLYLISNQGVVQFRSGKFKQAEESFRKALAIAPEDHFCWGTLGIVEYSQGQYDEAINALTKSLAINPKNSTVHNYLGITAAQKGWLDAAQKHLETAIQLDEKYADAYFNLAVVHTLRQPVKKSEASKSYKKAVVLGAAPDPSMENLLKE